MRLAVLFAFLSFGMALVISCGSGGTKSPARQTVDAAQSGAEKTPVSDTVQHYVRDLCDPFQTFFNEAKDTLTRFTATPDETPSDTPPDLSSAFSALGDLQTPLERFRDDLKSVEPPTDLRAFHDSLIQQMDYAIEIVKAIKTGGLFGALSAPTPPATPELPAGFDAALIQECGDQLAGVISEFGPDLLGGSGPVKTGAVGEAVHQGNFELTVHSVTDPYDVSEDSFAPQSGNRWVLIDVSLTNVSEEPQNYGSFDFTVHDTNDKEYTSGFANQTPELDFGSLEAGETIRGQVAYELPEGAALDRLVYDPTFDPADRIEITLQ